MDQMLVDAVVDAMIILETEPLNEDFDEETLEFFQDLYLWRRPEKFTVNGENYKFVAGRVTYFRPGQRVLQFEFDNGYIWDASITKLGTRTLIAHCRQLRDEYLNGEDEDLDEAAA